VCFFFQAEDGIRDWSVTGVQTCALPIFVAPPDRDPVDPGEPRRRERARRRWQVGEHRDAGTGPTPCLAERQLDGRSDRRRGIERLEGREPLRGPPPVGGPARRHPPAGGGRGGAPPGGRRGGGGPTASRRRGGGTRKGPPPASRTCMLADTSSTMARPPSASPPGRPTQGSAYPATSARRRSRRSTKRRSGRKRCRSSGRAGS